MPIQLPKQITYYTLSHEEFNKKKEMKPSHFVKASESGYELSNLYSSLNKSVEVIHNDFDSAKKLYSPTNLLLCYYDYYQKQQKALKQDVQHYADELHQPKCSSSINSMFSMLYAYPNATYDLTYSSIMKLGLAYLEHRHITCKFHTIITLKPITPQPLVMDKGCFQVIRTDWIRKSPYNFATARDFYGTIKLD